ncbi:methyl-accepting chemotaxis protein [Paenibacillus sp. 1011MAR3C5]|uniref:methyl-accepting chemotaxis protein n=1 Tax=Paenibacillus sp. 1011MAR3C5 TaxID=1675787 RepID=UPI0021759148|nr:methyl-accepting chemotaxis protein [Paenibacillus sp. 1011MAR3C5]
MTKQKAVLAIMAGKEKKLLQVSVKETGEKEEIIENGYKKEASVWRSFFTNPLKSVGLKIFIAIFGSILACVLTVGLLAYSEAKTLVEKKVSDASMQTINQVSSNLDVIFKTYEDLSLQLMIDKDFHEIVSQLATSNDDYERFEAARRLGDKMQGFTLGNNSIKGIMLLPLSDNLHIVAAGSSLSTRAEPLMKTEWYQKTIELNGKVNWIAPQPTGISMITDKPTIALTRLLKNTVSSEAGYMLVLEIEADTIVNRYKDVVLGDESELAIIDGNGNYVVANDAAKVGKAASISLPISGELALAGSPKLYTTDGVEVLAVYQKLQSMDWRLAGTIPVKQLVKDAESIRDITLVTALAAIVLAIAIGVLVIFAIARPLVKICSLMMEGARGNLTVRSSIRKRQDEIGTLSESFNAMMDQITGLAQQTTRSAEDVLHTASELTEASRKTSASAREIAAATEEIAGGATSLAVEAERGNELAAHINEQMKQVISANEEMVGSAASVEQSSEQGTAYMNALIQKTGMTEEMTRSMVEKVDALKESTGSIVKILDVLNNLTKQTNILSLNATIEAARAGAAGKGFMVVADEIRQLADQSRQSIDVVAQITGKIRSEIDETVQVLTEAYPLFQEQIVSVKEANGIFVSVQEQMAQFAQRLDGATSSIGQLEQSQQVLAEAMTNVSTVAEEASATSEEVASLSSEQLHISDNLVLLSEKLDAVSRGLKESLAQFKL